MDHWSFTQAQQIAGDQESPVARELREDFAEYLKQDETTDVKPWVDWLNDDVECDQELVAAYFEPKAVGHRCCETSAETQGRDHSLGCGG